MGPTGKRLQRHRTHREQQPRCQLLLLLRCLCVCEAVRAPSPCQKRADQFQAALRARVDWRAPYGLYAAAAAVPPMALVRLLSSPQTLHVAASPFMCQSLTESCAVLCVLRLRRLPTCAPGRHEQTCRRFQRG